MFVCCVACGLNYFECDLRDRRCIDCWAKIAGYEAQKVSDAEAWSQAFEKGYMDAHSLLVERGGRDVSVLKNPYDHITTSQLFGAWMQGRDSRLGAFQLFLKAHPDYEQMLPVPVGQAEDRPAA